MLIRKRILQVIADIDKMNDKEFPKKSGFGKTIIIYTVLSYNFCSFCHYSTKLCNF